MDQSKYWLQTRSRLPERPAPALGPRMLHAVSVAGSFYYAAESWEERAFAEDSAGLLGGFTWPPRSYTCSFCRREFRSAQALGGHMNVHRRDRARLKQSTSSESDGTATTTDRDHHPSSCRDMMSASDPRGISLAYDAEPATNPSNYTTPAAASLSSNSFVSPSFSSSETQDQKHEAPKNIINPRHDQLKRDKDHTLREADYHTPRSYPCRDDEEIVSVKRQRIGGLFPFLAAAAVAAPTTSSSIELEMREVEVLKLSTIAVEELDLELRLGCPSNCKAVLC